MTPQSNEYRDKFVGLLRELFQFDCADLDFGIYRIMNHKRDVIEKFISKDLPKAITKELESGVLADQSEAAKELTEVADQITESLGKDALDADGNLAEAYHGTPLGKKYLDLKRKAAGGRGQEALEAVIFNHLYSFFSRYYQEGDFISKRRYSKRQKYAIPYNGEEVYLHWANHDQYYVKTAEHFNDYSFTSRGVTVHFKLKAADVEQNNVKGDKRFFVPRSKEIEWDEKANELVIPFEYRPLTEQEEITFGKKNQQDAIIAAAISDIPKQLKKEDKALLALTSERRKTADGERVSCLEHHLRQYTRRNTSDFFIHKDLKGFLSRELDFYLKNEVLNLDEMEVAGEDRAEGWFQIVRVIKSVGSHIIDFLDQIESFQKMLWEKRKFITETQYCITVGNIDEKFYSDIATCEEQWQEWKKLFHIDEKKDDLFTNGKSKIDRRVAFLRGKPNMVIDTRNFESHVAHKLLANIEDIDATCDGLLICSENYQAIGLIVERYRENVRCIYIDPPFNLGENADFLYRVDYKDSTWMTLLENRLSLAKWLMRRDGSVFVRCNHDGNMFVRLLLDTIYGAVNFRNEIIVRRAEESKGDLNKQFGSIKSVTVNYDNIYWYSVAPDTRFERFLKPTKGKQAKAHWHSFWKAEDRPRMRYDILGIDLNNHYGQWMWSKERAYTAVDNYKQYLKETEKTKESLEEYWKRTGEKLEFVRRDGDGYSSIKYWIPPREFVMADNNWLDIKGYANKWGFKTENSEPLLKRVIEGPTKEAEIVMDFFVGSGTAVATAHKLHRRWVGVEMGDHFDTVLLPRMKSVLYGEQSGISKDAEWKGGGAFKYIRLENFEDTLDNIAFDDASGQEAMKFEDYLLKYMLKWETKHSETLLNTEKLPKPFSYKLKIHQDGQTREKAVDIPETFNYLLGLHVETRKVYDDDGRKYLVYRGRIDHRKVVIIWRETDGWKKTDLERDKKFVAKVKLTEGADEVFVNGDSFIPNAKALEPIFKARMFAPVEA